jgi:hypothetical protein
MNIVPVKWANSQKRFDVTQPYNDDHVTAVPRPPLRVMQEQRAREAAKAVEEYAASGRATEKKTERLRALRLAREAAKGSSKTLKTSR